MNSTITPAKVAVNTEAQKAAPLVVMKTEYNGSQEQTDKVATPSYPIFKAINQKETTHATLEPHQRESRHNQHRANSPSMQGVLRSDARRAPGLDLQIAGNIAASLAAASLGGIPGSHGAKHRHWHLKKHAQYTQPETGFMAEQYEFDLEDDEDDGHEDDEWDGYYDDNHDGDWDHSDDDADYDAYDYDIGEFQGRSNDRHNESTGPIKAMNKGELIREHARHQAFQTGHDTRPKHLGQRQQSRVQVEYAAGFLPIQGFDMRFDSSSTLNRPNEPIQIHSTGNRNVVNTAQKSDRGQTRKMKHTGSHPVYD